MSRSVTPDLLAQATDNGGYDIVADMRGVSSDAQEHTALRQLSVAARALDMARTLPEVKSIIDIAEAARVYARAAKLGTEAANAAMEIKILAQHKAGAMLAELEKGNRDRQQDKGGRFTTNSSLESVVSEYATVLRETQIAPVTAHRWQKLAEAPVETVRSSIQAIRDNNKEVSAAAVFRMVAPHVSHNSLENEWYTPSVYIEAARAAMGGIDLDPASCEAANEVIRAETYYTIADDGLVQSWFGRVWLNPPYAAGTVDQFVRRFADAVFDQEIEQGIVLVNNATETMWFTVLVSACAAVVFPRGRVRFWNSSGTGGAPLQGQAILYAGKQPERFMAEFRQFGWGAHL